MYVLCRNQILVLGVMDVYDGDRRVVLIVQLIKSCNQIVFSWRDNQKEPQLSSHLQIFVETSINKILGLELSPSRKVDEILSSWFRESISDFHLRSKSKKCKFHKSSKVVQISRGRD